MTAVAETIHATTVAVMGTRGEWRGAVIVGPSGSGKSSLALQLIALGARLVADDRTELRRIGDTVEATAPATVSGLIEARGLGLLRLPVVERVGVQLLVDMARAETARLPEPGTAALLGVNVPRIYCTRTACFASSVFLYLSHGAVSLET